MVPVTTQLSFVFSAYTYSVVIKHNCNAFAIAQSQDRIEPLQKSWVQGISILWLCACPNDAEAYCIPPSRLEVGNIDLCKGKASRAISCSCAFIVHHIIAD